MRNIMKVAKWEIKRNMKNKSFIIGLFITPIIFLIFFFVPSFFSDSTEPEKIDLYVNDELTVIDDMKSIATQHDLTNLAIHETDRDVESAQKNLLTEDNTAYIHLNETALNDGILTFYTSETIDSTFSNSIHLFEAPIQHYQLKQHGFSDDQLNIALKGITFDEKAVESNHTLESITQDSDPFEKLIPGGFAGIILFSILISGMMIFQSASQEKKEKIAEIILSSITPNELMQGKIIGYFVLGLIQVFVWMSIAVTALAWKFKFPIIDYLFVPELILLLTIAILGYLFFAALFVGIGATIEDVSTSGNFQGLVLMLPFLPIIFAGPVISDPNGLVAKVTSFIPFTSPAILIIRLSFIDEWPWGEIISALIVLIISVWLFMKLAGKIFRTGILLYGKNATPKEIWKWLWI